MRKFLKLASAVLAAIAALLGAAIANNNLPQPSESRADFETKLNRSFEGSAAWMAAQIREANMYGRWMVHDCAVLSGDARLKEFLDRVKKLDSDPFYLRMTDESSPLPDPSSYTIMDRRPNYSRWLFHALSRKQYPLSVADQAELFQTGHRTGRATHQLFALIFYRKFNGETPELKALIRKVAEGIAQEAGLDFRVTDLYLQRIAFLLAAGYPDLVQPRWVERALANQQPNGGWRFGWYGWQPTPYKFDPDEAESSHATAQGMHIACMLKHRYPNWIAAHYR